MTDHTKIEKLQRDFNSLLDAFGKLQAEHAEVVKKLDALTNPPRVRVEAGPRYEGAFPDSTYRLMDQFSVPKHITDAMAEKIGDDVVRDVVADARRGR
jgi:hypothetical protein